MSENLRKKVLSFIRAFKIPLIYLILSTIWIFTSDIFVESLTTNPKELTKLQTIKGWIFVLASAALVLYFLIKNDRMKIEKAFNEEKIIRENAERMKQKIQEEQEQTRM
ncbi:MAG: hypothetical protein ACUVRG_08960, partial [Ignavibacterium sp.]